MVVVVVTVLTIFRGRWNFNWKTVWWSQEKDHGHDVRNHIEGRNEYQIADLSWQRSLQRWNTTDYQMTVSNVLIIKSLILDFSLSVWLSEDLIIKHKCSTINSTDFRCLSESLFCDTHTKLTLNYSLHTFRTTSTKKFWCRKERRCKTLKKVFSLLSTDWGKKSSKDPTNRFSKRGKRTLVSGYTPKTDKKGGIVLRIGGDQIRDRPHPVVTWSNRWGGTFPPSTDHRHRSDTPQTGK